MKEKIQTASNLPLYKIDSIFVATMCTEVLRVPDIGVTITTFRKMFPHVMIQGINPGYVFGKRHIFEVIKIILESNRRKIRIAKRLEMELLLRLVCSNQVDKAIKIGGIKNNGSACFILLSEKEGQIIDSLKYLRKILVEQNSSLLNATKVKMIKISERFDFSCGDFNKKEFLKILTEKAALVSL
jgi:tRNA threonylcarbamoyladenosine modification (KEOPS) complex Cgi121 subunit